MNFKFDLSKIEEYIKARDEYLSKHLQYPKDREFNLSAIFSIFDTNHDGKISRNEFKKVSREEYNNYVEQLKNYNLKNGNGDKNNSIWNYDQLESYLEDAFITPEEVENNGNIISKYGNMSGAREKEEVCNLKDLSQMSKDEMVEELESYGVDTNALSEQKLRSMLEQARKERIKYDKGSDGIDGHIGTYSQGINRYCTVLAELDTLSDEELAQIYNKEPKVDANGEKYWEVKFPCDNDTDITVIITEEELRNRAVTIKDENGNEREIADFPEGDDDVLLLTMAYVKRFSGDITDNGAWAFKTKNNFVPSDKPQYKDNQHLEDYTSADFMNLPKHSQVGLLNKEELERKGISTEANDIDLSWLPPIEQARVRSSVWGTFELSDGRKGYYGSMGIVLSDGTKIVSGHALSVRGYDSDTNELIVSQNEFGNLTELRIPMELAKFFETASLDNAPGVKRTPQPEFE